MMMKRSGEREHPCFVPLLHGRTLSFSPLSICTDFFVHILYAQIEKVPLYYKFTESFYHDWVLEHGSF